MPSVPLITLTTDFGTRDPYVASMKGVIYTRCPEVQVVDLTHEIIPQSVVEGAMFLETAAPYFDRGTIHVGVVDPGVGSARLPIVLLAGGQYFIGPNNGLFTLVLRRCELEAVYAIENPGWQRSGPISATFHGRDIFAPAAAMLAAGHPIEAAGAPLENLESLHVPEPKQADDGTLQGTVIHIDRFGNCITNLNKAAIPRQCRVELPRIELVLDGVGTTYADVRPGETLALYGSTDLLEIATRDTAAAAIHGIAEGDHVLVRPVA